jgi:3-hydroxyisobutyrate dehydrogenase-like beta-hydroxyacid dehydrogenase
VVYNRTRAKAEPLLAAGARLAFTPRDVGRTATAKVVFTLVSDAKALDRVLFGRDGLARGLGAGALVVDLSTVAPAQSRAFAEKLATIGVHFVDAPLGGSVEAARNGRLIVFVGGAAEDVARARPFLEQFGRRIEHLGPVGAGTSMKLVNNLLTISYVALAGEALALAEGFGLDRRRTIDLLLDGGGYSRLFEQKRIAFEERRYPAQFRLRLAEKDLRLLGHAAHAAGREAGLAHEAGRLVTEAVRAGHGEEDFASVFEAALVRRPRVRHPVGGPAATEPVPGAPAG